ncbi:MAG: hypothetical protein FH753_01000 [Firmicutes bacterium]|nr:hypothetical protein [Bacillota bacterium]
MSKEGNQYWNGRNGRIWIDDRKYANAKTFEATKTNNYEEVPSQNGFGTVQVFTGFGIEGTITLRKVGNEEIIDELRRDKTGQLDVSLVGKTMNHSTGQTERIKYIGVTFDSVDLTKFDKDTTVTELELPFKAEDYDIL